MITYTHHRHSAARFSSYIQLPLWHKRQQHEASTRDSNTRQQKRTARGSSTRAQHKIAAIYQWHHSSNVCCKPLSIVESTVHFCVPRAAQEASCTPTQYCTAHNTQHTQHTAHSICSTTDAQHSNLQHIQHVAHHALSLTEKHSHHSAHDTTGPTQHLHV